VHIWRKVHELMSVASELDCLIPHNGLIHATNALLIWIFSFLISLLNPCALICKVGCLLVFLQPVISDWSWIEACSDETRHFSLRMQFFSLLDGAYSLPLVIPWTYAGHLLLILLPCSQVVYCRKWLAW
jgi:uncharacterized membrane protein